MDPHPTDVPAINLLTGLPEVYLVSYNHGRVQAIHTSTGQRLLRSSAQFTEVAEAFHLDYLRPEHATGTSSARRAP